MALLLISTDLMAHSRIEGVARSAGHSFQTSTPTAAIEAAIDLQPKLVLIDLATTPVEIASLVAELREAVPETKLLAFGPHVHQARLDAAQAAGCDEVLTRGKFFGQLAELVACSP